MAASEPTVNLFLHMELFNADDRKMEGSPEESQVASKKAIGAAGERTAGWREFTGRD